MVRTAFRIRLGAPASTRRNRFHRTACLALAALGLAGCAGLSRPIAQQPRPGDHQDAACLAWIEPLDAAVARAGVADAEADRIPGFATLRVNRFLAAQAPRARASAAFFDNWLEQLRQLDEQARRVEIANLPGDALPAARDTMLEQLVRCGHRLAQAAANSPSQREALLQRARVEDRYSTPARVAGLYALTRLPFFAGVRAWQNEHQREMQDVARRTFAIVRLRPAESAAAADDAHLASLLAAHAPVFEIETAGAFDRIGMPAWQGDGSIAVDTGAPVVFERISHTLVRGQPLLQLVYTLWFPERPLQGPFDLLGGRLDGVIVRLTLAPDGRPWLLDTIHACGCYHLFVPAAELRLREGASVDEEWAFVPQRLPAWRPGERFVLRIASATHQVVGVGIVAAPDVLSSAPTESYRRRPENELRMLPLPPPATATRSLYGPDGLVAGSERRERFFFWPLGITSAGAMRQWGHHATAFVGRRHFDDADLLDRRFVFPGLE